MEGLANSEKLNTALSASVGIENVSDSSAGKCKRASEINWLTVFAEKLGIIFSENSDLRAFSFTDTPLCRDELDFIDALSDKTKLLLEAMEAAEAAVSASAAVENSNTLITDGSGENSGKNAESLLQQEPFSANMSLNIHFSRDLMTAYCCVFPPIGQGQSLSVEELYKLVESNGVKCGVDESVIQNVLDTNSMLKIFVIARGVPQKDGVDGGIRDHYSREQKINITSKEGNIADYKNLNWLQTIHANDVICDIIKPKPEENGVDVRGVEIKAIPGKKPKVPAGKNTAISEDGLMLIATTDGQLSYKGGVFRVDQVVNIDGDIDNSIGNLDVIGSINVNGNVTEGFSLAATGDIVVRGIVEGAYLNAGGNIQIFHGMNGNLKGRLEARGDITSKYLQNCSVCAEGTVKAGSIVSCTVVSNDKVSVLNGKGTIIASSITGSKGIEAKIVGNDRNRLSSLTVGSDPSLVKELKTLKTEVLEMSKNLEENEKNIRYIEGMGEPDLRYQQLLSKLKLDIVLDKMKLSKKKRRIIAISDLLNDASAQIIASELHPPVNISMGNLKLNLLQEERMCRIYKIGGEIIIGTI